MNLTSINVNNTLVTRVDSEPTLRSNNLITSDGVFNPIRNIHEVLDTFSIFCYNDYSGKLQYFIPLDIKGSINVKLTVVQGSESTYWRIYHHLNGSIGLDYNTYAFGDTVTINVPTTDDGIVVFAPSAGAENSIKYKVEISSNTSVIKRLGKLESELQSQSDIIGELEQENVIFGYKVNYQNDTIMIESISANRKNNQRITFSKFGPNELMQIDKIEFLYGQTTTYQKTAGTDSLGPYRVHAVNNADGDSQTNSFTGGCHGYNGDSTGSATASGEYNVYVDNVKINESENIINGKKVEIVVTNKIQGWNTKKSDGSGRAILQEAIHYKFENGEPEIRIESEIKALEAIVIDLYYGLQIAFARDYVRFNGKKFYSYKAHTTGSIICYDSKLDSVDCKGNDGLVQRMSVAKEGIGHFNYNTKEQYAFMTGGSQDKTYYQLIEDSDEIESESVLFMRGYYKFSIPEMLGYTESVAQGDTLSSTWGIDISEYKGKTIKLKVNYDSSALNYQYGSLRFFQASIIDSTGIIGDATYIENSNTYTVNVDQNTNYLWIFENLISASSDTEVIAIITTLEN